MAYHNGTSVAGAVQAPPVVSQLQRVFDSLEDAPLLNALTGPVRRGPKGHPVKVLWHCFVARYVLGLESTRELIRMLTNNPYVAEVCGVAGNVPYEATFSRFFAKMAKRKYLHLVKDVSRRLVREHYKTLPGFGKRVAMDSTTIKAWSNGGKKGKKPKEGQRRGYKPRTGMVSDPDAGWSVKKNTQGKTTYIFGYKAHLLVDCEYELPIAANISAGNVHDAERASNLLSEARWTYTRFRPKFVMADAAYSGKPLFRLIKRQYRAQPIISVNPAHKKLMAEFSAAMETPEWKALYGQRQAAEHVNSRLKGQRALNDLTVRRLRKVTVHCYLSLIAMQAMSG